MSKLTNTEKVFVAEFIQYCNERGVDYQGYNVEQMEAFMMDYIKESGNEDKVEVKYDEKGDLIVKMR